MKVVVFVAVLGALAPIAAAGQSNRPPDQAPAQVPDRVAQAYAQFLIARSIQDDDVEAAIAAYKRAMELDPGSAAIPAELASLYMREERLTEALQTAEQVLKISPTNRDAHRVLGTIHATLAIGTPDTARAARAQQEHLTQAIQHLEQAIEPPAPSADANLRAMLSRLYIAKERYDKAIPLLAELVKEEPSWQDGPALLVEAYSAAGRSAEAMTWLEEAAPENPRLYAMLADFYRRDRRWEDAAAAYEQAVRAMPGNIDLRVRFGSSLLSTGNRADVLRARDVLREAVKMKGADESALSLLSQAERRAGDPPAAESVARRLITQNGKNPRGYSALAEALEDQRRFQAVVDALVPATAMFRDQPDGAFALSIVLPHLGFAYQELGQYDKGIAAFEEARRIAPNDPSFTGYLVQAHVAAKNYTQAAELARAARAKSPNDLRLARLESLALRRSGKVEQGLAILEELIRAQPNNPNAHVALAQGYADASRGEEAVKLLQDAQQRFPTETEISFELGAVLDKQKKFAESEAIFRQLVAKEPDNARALNYLGYILAERGERLNESVDFLKRALAIEPENGSYLDSIGWAYFKDGKLDLALENLKRAADQLTTNSVVQNHYGEVLFKLGRYSDAIVAWNKALAGDGESIDRQEIDKKIRTARQKLPKR